MCAYRVFARRLMGRSGGEERPLCVWSMCIPVLGRNNSFKRVNIPAILRVWCSGLLKSRLRTRIWWAERRPGLYALFLKGQWHQGIFSLVKGTLWGNRTILSEHFKVAKAMTRGHGGNCQCCLRAVSGLEDALPSQNARRQCTLFVAEVSALQRKKLNLFVFFL
jgi:hypothetical protein